MPLVDSYLACYLVTEKNWTKLNLYNYDNALNTHGYDQRTQYLDDHKSDTRIVL